MSNATLTLSAYLVREAACLGDTEPVILSAGAEAVREMALAAIRQHDAMRAVVEAAREWLRYLEIDRKAEYADGVPGALMDALEALDAATEEVDDE